MVKNYLHELHRLRMANYEVEDMCNRYDMECGMCSLYTLTNDELEMAKDSQYELNKIIERKKNGQ